MAGQLGSYKIAISPDLASFKTVSRTVGSSLRGAQQQIDRSMNFSGVSAAASKAVTATLCPIAIRVISILAQLFNGLRIPASSPGTSMPVRWPSP